MFLRSMPSRMASRSFTAFLVISYFLLVFHFGKDEWFTQPDWALLLRDRWDLFSPNEQHWEAVPLILLHALYLAFGVDYLPFLMTVCALHIGIVAMLRVIMRRAGVAPWPASLVAATLALFGPGYLAIVFSQQIAQDLSILLGLVHLVLADHDGDIRGRDWLGLLAGAMGVASSGLAPIFVFGTALCVLLRRGFRIALFHSAPLAALYLAWFYFTRPTTFSGADPYRFEYDLRNHATFVWRGFLESTLALGHIPPLAAGTTALLVAGIGLRLFGSTGRLWRESTRTPLVLLACSFAYFVVVGYQRSSSGIAYAGYSHHLYTALCFHLPLLACAADAVMRRFPRSSPFVLASFLALIPLNAKDFGTFPARRMTLVAAFSQLNRQRLEAVAHSPYLSQARHLNLGKDATYPWYVGPGSLTLGWVLEQKRHGRIPMSPRIEPRMDDDVQLFYGVNDLGPPPDGPCEPHEGPLELRPRVGDTLATRSPVVVWNLRHAADGAATTSFEGPGHTLQFELADLNLRVTPGNGERALLVCRSPAQTFRR